MLFLFQNRPIFFFNIENEAGNTPHPIPLLVSLSHREPLSNYGFHTTALPHSRADTFDTAWNLHLCLRLKTIFKPALSPCVAFKFQNKLMTMTSPCTECLGRGSEALLFSGWVTLGDLLNLSESDFSLGRWV